MAQQSPLISVIIPAYNAQLFVAQAVRQIKAQHQRDFECIIVDDGSSDDTAKVATAAIGSDRRFHIVTHARNLGLAAARNSGFAAATGRYVIFLDVDDEFDPALLEETSTTAQESGADVVAFNFSEEDVTTGARIESIIDESFIPDEPFAFADLRHLHSPLLLNSLGNTVWNKLLRREFLMQHDITSHTQLRRAEDLDFSLRCYLLARRIVFIKQPLLSYHTHIATSNQGTLGQFPTNLFDALLVVQEFLKAHRLLGTYKTDLWLLAADLIESQLRMLEPAAQRTMLAAGADFVTRLGVTERFIQQEPRVAILGLLQTNDYDGFVVRERQRLQDQKNELLAQIPQLEARIALELEQVRLYRDEPSVKVAFDSLQKALARSVSRRRPRG